MFRNYPGAKHGGNTTSVNFTRSGWLPRGATKLKGNNAHAYSDVNDDNKANASEEVHPDPVASSTTSWRRSRSRACRSATSSPAHGTRRSRSRGATTARRTPLRSSTSSTSFHDHLLAEPIGFTEAAGNFQTANASKQGKGHDAVETQAMDGATTDNGLPDGNHVDNANMNTPPDGTPPTMQMYLQHQPGTSYPDGDPFPAINTGDEANTVYHEYTHGLSNRLVVDVLGNSTLGPIQGGAMGEAWSDWYADDFLVSNGLEMDRKGKADLDGLPLRRRGGVAPPDPGHRLHPVVAQVAVPRRGHRPRRRLHLRRLRQGHRRARGARRRRDLGRRACGRCATRSVLASR